MTTALLSLPLWMQFLAGFILLGLGLVFILMPFSVFGVKPRLEEVELQLSEVRAELRIIAMRLAQGGNETGPSGEPVFVPPRRTATPAEPAPLSPRRQHEMLSPCVILNPCPGRPRQPVRLHRGLCRKEPKRRVRRFLSGARFSVTLRWLVIAANGLPLFRKPVTITVMQNPALRKVCIAY